MMQREFQNNVDNQSDVEVLHIESNDYQFTLAWYSGFPACATA